MTPIKYQLVSEAVVLRDYQAPKYLNEEHEKLVDIADTLYNVGGANILAPTYKALYDKHGVEYWDKVMADIKAINSQIDHYNVGELAEEYQEMLEEGEK